MATLEALQGAFGDAAPGRIACFGSLERRLRLRDGSEFPQFRLASIADLQPRPTLLLHYAFLTRDKVTTVPIAEYVSRNRDISDFVAGQAERIGVRGAVVISSGAVYNRDRSLATDLDSNPYGVLKLEEERRFSQWAGRVGAALALPRLFNLSGPYINKHSAYVLASLILDALAGRPMQLRAAHPVVRSYTGVAQLISVCLGLATEVHGDICAFDTAGESEIEVGDLGLQINRALGTVSEIRRPRVDPGNPDRYVGDGTVYRDMARRFGADPEPLDRQIRDTGAFLARSARGSPGRHA